MATLPPALAVFTIPGQTSTIIGGGRPYRPENDALLHINDPQVRRLFSECGPLHLKKRTIVPIRSIDAVTGRVDFYLPGDSMPVNGVPRHWLAVHMALFHTLGWSDAESPGCAATLPFVYHSFLLAFAVDDARLYNGSFHEGDIRATLDQVASNYLRANYWVCRIRCCDQQADGNWKDADPEEIYNRTIEAVRRVLADRGALLDTAETATPRMLFFGLPRYRPALVVWPDDRNRTLAIRVFQAEKLEDASHPHCSHHEAEQLACAAKRANEAAKLLLRRPLGGVPVIEVPPPVRASSSAIHQQRQQLLHTAMSLMSIGTVKQVGQSVQARGDHSGYAQEWERIMRDYDATATGDRRAQVICKELMIRGIVPLTVAEQNGEVKF